MIGTLAGDRHVLRWLVLQFLRSKLEQLESKLENERIARKKLEQDIVAATCKPAAKSKAVPQLLPGQLQSNLDSKQP